MRNFYVFARIALFCIAWLVGFGGLAQSRYWVGGSGNWSDSQHWSYTSGGNGGAEVPNSGTNVIIDKNSFTSKGYISLTGDVEAKSLYWTSDAANSGIIGTSSIKLWGNVIFESLASKDWAGQMVLGATNNSILKIPNSQEFDLIFDLNAHYKVLSNVAVSKGVIVNGDNVDFTKHKVKAAKVVASDVVKKTISSSFLKATMSGGNTKFTITYTTKSVSCPGSKDGIATVTKVDGGDGNYTYEWYDENDQLISGATTNEIKNVKKAVYTVSITDGTGVNDYFTITVDGPLPLTFSKVDVVNLTCNGGAAGSIKVLVNFGTPSYTYSIDNGANFGTSNYITGLTANSYNLVVKDNNKCLYSYPKNPIVISQPNDIVLDVTKVDVSGCFGNANGSIIVKATGGTVDSPLECSIDGTTFFSLPDAGYTFQNLTSGGRTVTVRRVNDKSCLKTASITVDQPGKLSATATANPVSGCSVTPDGQIVISGATGGSGAFEYSIDGGGTWAGSNTFTGLSANTYNVQIRDKSNPSCIQILNATLQVTAKPALTATVASTNVTCNGANNGTITFTSPQGGSGEYEYSIIAGTWVSSGSFTGLAPKDYTPQIRDKNNPVCAKSLTAITITEPAVLNAGTPSKVDVSGCYNATNGSITINTPTGGSGQYEYSINGTTWQSATTFANLGKGTYPVQMRDKLSTTCVKSLGSVVINAPAQITSLFSKTDITGCPGNSNGAITFNNTAGGSGAYDFSINNGTNWQASNAFNGLNAGAYTLLVRDRASTGCVSTIGSANIIDIAPLAATINTTSSCASTPTGTIVITTPTGGSGTYKFSLDNVKWFEGPAKKDYTFQNLQPNTYDLYMQDGNSCSKSLGKFTVGQLANLTATVDVKGLSGCSITNNGSISVKNPSGAPSGVYEYSLNGTNWVTTSDFTNLAAGKYSVFIREKNSQCFTLLGNNYEVLPLTLLAITSTSTIDPTCFGGLTGSITVEASGGTAPLMYSNGGVFQANKVFSNLAANNYVITVKDNAGCTQTKNVTLNNPAEIIPTITKVDIGCANAVGQISIPNVSGGTAPYNYSNTSGTTYQPSSTFTNLAASTYKVRVKDNNGCESTIKDVTIDSKPILDVAVAQVNDVKPCKGNSTGSIVLNVKSGTAPYKYKIGSGALTDLNASGTIDNLAAGKYDVTVVDGTNCTLTLSGVQVNEPAVALSANYTKSDVTACPANGTIKVSALGGMQPYSFSKDNGVNYTSVASGVADYTFGNLSGGTYGVKAKDANGCIIDLGSVTIAPNSLALTATPTNINCKGGTGKIDVSASGGASSYQFALNDDNYKTVTSFTGLTANTYTVKVKDAGGCIVSKPVIISEPATAVQATVQGFDLSCNGANDGHITVQASGGTPNYTITLNPGNIQKTGVSSADFTGLKAGNYTVSVVDSKCPTPVSKDITIVEPAAVNITLDVPTIVQPSCASPSSVTIKANVTASDGSKPTVSFDLLQGTTVVTTNTTGLFDNVAPGKYTINAYVGKCASVTSGQITINNPLASGLTLAVTKITQIKCFGDKANVEAQVTGGTLPYVATVNVTLAGPSTNVTFDKTTGKVTASNLDAGNYIFTLSDGTCSQTQNVTIDKGPDAAIVLGTPTISRPTTATSTDGSISIAATGGTPDYQYSLNPASPVNSNPSTTGVFGGLGVNDYLLTALDSKGCSTQQTIKLTATPSSVTADIVSKDIVCNGANNGQIDITITSGLAPYNITVASTGTAVSPITTSNSSYSITGLAKGDYTIIVTDANGTSTTPVTKSISEPTLLSVGLSNATTTLCFGDNNGKIDIAANGGTAPYKSIVWLGDKGSTGNIVGTAGTASNLSADKYTVTVTDAAGCIASATHTIASNTEIVAVVNAINPTCGGNGLGSIMVTATGGTTPPAYTYSKDGSTFVSSGSFTNLAVNTYKVVVKDGVGCLSVAQQVEIKAASTIVIVDPIQKTDAHCGVNGTITATATGGSGDLTYNLRRSGKKDLVASNKTGKFIDVPAGKYFVEVTDGGTCPATSSTITIAPGGTSSIIEVKRDVDNIQCSGGAGQFTVWVKGIVGAVQYDVIDLVNSVTLKKGIDYNLTSTAGVNPGEYTIILSDIRAGKYKLQVWDDNACPQSFAFAFTDPEVLKVDSFNKVDPKSKTSNDGSITVVASGGTAPYAFSLYDDSNNLVDVSDDGNFTSLAPGKYMVKVKGQGECEVSTPIIELVVQSNLDFDNVIANNPNCHGEVNGSIEVYASGGVGKLSYSIDNGQTFQDNNIFSNLAAGVYNVVVKDELGVTITQQITLKDPDEVKLILVRKKLPSAGTVSDGSVTVIASGGTGVYTISITDKVKNKELMNTLAPSVEVSFNNLQSSTYRVVAIDENGCTAVLDPIVLERLSATATSTDVTCGNATTGKIDVTIKGGTEPYKISWKLEGGTDSTPADVTGNTYTIKDLAAGKYIITITDAAGGSISITKTIKSLFTPIVATVAKVSDPICPEGLNGTIELAISGGKPAYTPIWTPETPSPADPTGTYTTTGTGGIISGLRPSKYSINITDANGCSVVVEATVANTPAIVIESTVPAPAKCNGDANGSITVKASGGVGELKYSTTVDGNVVENTTGQFDNLKAGKYVVTVTDTKNCSTKTAEVEVTEPAPLDLKVKEVIDQGCSTPGKVTVEVANSTGKITYKLDNNISNETGIFDGLSEGSHTIVATNETGCSASITQEIKSTASIKITKVATTDLLCNGSANGKLQFDVEERELGGLDGLKVEVNGAAVTKDPVTNLYIVEGLKAGDVTIVANNSKNCRITEIYKIAEPEKLAATVKVTKVPANDTDKTGELVVTVVGGVAPYSISCTNMGTNEKQELSGASVTFQGLARGKYQIVATDANGCAVTADVVTVGAPSIAAKGISGSCKDPKGSIEVTITDGAKPYTVSYTKKGDAAVLGTKTGDENIVTFTGVDPGDYTVTMVDASGNAAAPVDVNVPVYTAPTITLVAKCFVNNDYYIEIKTPDGLNDYTVKCTDADGVSYTNYNPTTHRISGLQPNKTYSVHIEDVLGCSSEILTVEVATLPELKVEDPLVTNVLCNGAATGKVELKASGGTGALSYALTPETSTVVNPQVNPVFENQLAGKYHAVISDASGCFDSRLVEITQPTEMLLTLDKDKSKTNIWCASKTEGVLAFNVADAVPAYTVNLYIGDKQIGESKTLNGPGPDMYENLPVGAYRLVSVDKNGCSKTLAQDIGGEHIYISSSLTPAECRRFVTPQDAKTYGGVFMLTKMYGNFDPTATYFFKKGSNLLAEPVEPVSNPDQTGYYEFKPGDVRTISQLQGITYSILVKVVEPKGVCEEEISFNVPTNPANDFNAVAWPDKSLCINSTIDFMGDIKVNNDKSKYELNSDGSFKLDNNGNPIPKHYFVEWTNVENSKIDIESTSLMELETQDKVKQPVKITYDMVSTKKKPYTLVRPYIFRVTSRNNVCYDQDTAKVEVYPFSGPYFTGPLVKEVEGTGYFMRLPLGATQDLLLKYRMNDYEKNVVWDPKDAGWFIVDPTDNNKVTVYGNFGENADLRAVVTYKVNDTEVCEETAGLKVMPLTTINPPNAFTPNGDGFNDTWRVIYDEEMAEYPNLEVEIYNRWGSIIYHAKPYKNDWNGKHNGKDLPVGTYYYVIKLHRGVLPNITGGVSIIR